ncbi:TPA: phage tail protein [Escherichia coli]|nr:phage tail protein [Escherichia coli]
MGFRKLTQVRRYLLEMDPWLRDYPEMLHVAALQGRVTATLAPRRTFTWDYDMEIIVEQYAGDIDFMAGALLAWAARHQHDLLANRDRREEAFIFEAILLDNDTARIRWLVPVTENVVTEGEPGSLTFHHVEPAPPELPENEARTGWQMTVTDEFAGEIIPLNGEDT